MSINSTTSACPIDVLQSFTSNIFFNMGMPDQDAHYMAKIIIASELAGHECHGMRRVPEYVSRWREGKANPITELRIEKDSGSILAIDAQAGFGHVVMRDATNLAIERAKLHGVSVVAVRRSEAAGRFADYCAHAADAGVITLMFANDSGSCQEVAPPGGQAARMSTNPIAFGIPRLARPHLVLDMATSSVAFGRLLEARDRGEIVPNHWLNQRDILVPFGGLKGFGLALVVEALAGALTGGGTVSATPNSDDQAVLLIAIDVNHLRDLGAFTEEVESFVAYIKDVPLEEGAAPVRMPGESGAEKTAHLSKEGIIVRRYVRERLSIVADELGVEIPSCLRPDAD